MLINLHSHTTFCDGDNSAEEMVLSAIENNFSAIGFSGHGYTPFDLTYCMKNTDVYINEINHLKEKYKKEILVYLGTEEDCRSPITNRNDYDYIIGSSHYFEKNGNYYSVDHSYEHFKKCVEVFNGDTIAMAENYYSNFCEYIIKRKPDIIGHFDLITKFDEYGEPYFLGNPEYERLAIKFIDIAASSGCIFEVNTGAISRGYRNTPYPSAPILHRLKKLNAKLTITSDSHSVKTLDFHFKETRDLLKEIGFKNIYNLIGKEFIKENL